MYYLINKSTNEIIAKITTDSISLDDAIALMADEVNTDKTNDDDYDYIINGVKCWFDELDVIPESQYKVVKFALCCEDFEFKAANITCPEDVWDEYERESWEAPETVKEFTSKEEALAALEKCKNVAQFTKWSPRDLATGELYYVEEQEYDENGEFLQGNGRYACENWDFDEELASKE